MTRHGKLLALLGAWLIANFVPHLIVFLATGKIYYQLPAVWMIVAEGSIMVLNLILPIAALRYLFRQTGDIGASLGWRWTGWQSLWMGLLGFLAFLLVSIATQLLIGDPLATPGLRFDNLTELALGMVLLLALTAAAEETMFRGWIQATLTQDYGAWLGVGVTLLLFGLRHLPMDLYAGLSQRVPASAWISRILQLYLGALVFGIVRHRARSTWASWIVHEGFLLLIVVLGVVTAL